MEIGVAGPISIQKFSKAICDNDIHNIQNAGKILWQLFIFMELEPFPYYFVITKTLNLSQER